MKPTIPIWLLGLAALAVVNERSRSSNSCCALPIEDKQVTASSGDQTVAPAEKNRESLSKVQSYVGQWKGVGQPKRGSNKDAWVEKADWAWKFAASDAALIYRSEDAKYFRSAELRPATKANEYELSAKTVGGAEVKYVGSLGAEGLTLSAATPVEDAPSRISIRMVAGGDRMAVLYERKAEGDRFMRLAEVNSTREGSGFGKGTSYVECVVTGGLGTIAVTHQGKTYYVCCTGCRDYFNDNPDAVLAEYHARKEAKKK